MKVFRLLRLLHLFVEFFVRGFFIKLFYFRNPQMRDKLLRRSVHLSALYFTKIFGIKAHPENWAPFIATNRLVVSNHLSYIDIIAYLSVEPFCFLTSKEVYKNWFTGPFIRFSGSSYVDRRSPASLRSEFDRLSSLLKETSIVIFPEATTSNGEKVLSFKRGLLEWARREQMPVQSVCLQYISWNTQKLNRSRADRIFYYGEMEIFPHIWRFLETSQVQVRLNSATEAWNGKNYDSIEDWVNALEAWVSTKYQETYSLIENDAELALCSEKPLELASAPLQDEYERS